MVEAIGLTPEQYLEMKELNVSIKNKKDSWGWRFVGMFMWSIMGRWTTWRWPWQSHITIWTAKEVGRVNKFHQHIISHELFHCRDIQGSWLNPVRMGLLNFFIPLPVVFSGRWFIEREAYLEDIRDGRLTIDKAASILWWKYFLAWPPPLSRRWFRKNLHESE